MNIIVDYDTFAPIANLERENDALREDLTGICEQFADKCRQLAEAELTIARQNHDIRALRAVAEGILSNRQEELSEASKAVVQERAEWTIVKHSYVELVNHLRALLPELDKRTRHLTACAQQALEMIDVRFSTPPPAPLRLPSAGGAAVFATQDENRVA